MISRQRWLVLLVLAATALAACGSGGGSPQPSSGGPSEGAPSQATESDAPEPSEGGGGGDLPEVGDNLFSGGKMKIDVSGDADFEADVEANGIVTGGAVFLTGSNESLALQIAWSTTEGGGIAMTTTDLVVGAEFTSCDLNVTKNDPTGLSGTVECIGADAIKNGITGIKVDIRVGFEVHP